MKQIKRAEFLGVAAGNVPVDEKLNIRETPVNEFANKVLPHFGSRSTTTLAPYAGAFGTTQLSHLLRRTLFGLTKADLAAFSGMTLDQSLNALLTLSAAPSPPLNAYNDTNFTDADIPAGQTWVNAAGAQTVHWCDAWSPPHGPGPFRRARCAAEHSERRCSRR